MIDLRSDTVTQPCTKMRQSMAEAPLGDDVYGDDPSVIQLEQYVAELCGFEAALFVPSGTMSNQIAINIHCRPGDSILAEDGAHCYAFEAGAASALSGVQFQFLGSGEGAWTRPNLEECFIADGLHSAPVKLIVVENTHNRSGGRAIDIEALETINEFSRSKRVATHCDGARIWNAAVVLGRTERDLLAGFDSASVCFSKGLGAPIGSALLGSKEFIAVARKVRKRLGGGMRQAGVIASAALYALQNNRKSIDVDHSNAAQMIESLKSSPAAKQDLIEFAYPEPVTNMVYFRIKNRDGDLLNSHLAKNGISANHLGKGWVRLVTHRDLSSNDISSVCGVLGEIG